jgi:hypothetical protein
MKKIWGSLVLSNHWCDFHSDYCVEPFPQTYSRETRGILYLGNDCGEKAYKILLGAHETGFSHDWVLHPRLPNLHTSTMLRASADRLLLWSWPGPGHQSNVTGLFYCPSPNTLRPPRRPQPLIRLRNQHPNIRYVECGAQPSFWVHRDVSGASSAHHSLTHHGYVGDRCFFAAACL